MITVIIPTLNEEEHIESVIRFAQKQPNVTEVIVVDDKSLDNTVTFALAAGARVITSTKLGKGTSMKEGVMNAANNIVVFLDGDIDPYPHYTIKLLTDPIINGEADFVKASFSRNAGRVTELVAKPLLSIFFPDLLRFSQPLSGMIAGRKEVFSHIGFREDYGVDIGILIDMYLANVRIKEVEIGYIENKSKPWQALGRMSREVAGCIIQKAALSHNPNYNFEELGVLSQIRSQMDFALENHLRQLSKLIVFDMDNTILQGRFIDVCAKYYGFTNDLLDIRSAETDVVIITKRIAMLLKDKPMNELIGIADNMQVVQNTAAIVAELRQRGYITGIISDSYDIITNHIRIKLGMDFSLSNELEFSMGVCTGEVKIPSFLFNQPQSVCKHNICKTNALLSVLNQYNINRSNSIAIGDSLNDLCMIRNAGVGVAFCSANELVNQSADIKITDPSFSELLRIAH